MIERLYKLIKSGGRMIGIDEFPGH